jgi:hypothetical protein
LQQPEHRSFALDLAKAWISLAEDHERKMATPDPTDLMGKSRAGSDRLLCPIVRSDQRSSRIRQRGQTQLLGWTIAFAAETKPRFVLAFDSRNRAATSPFAGIAADMSSSEKFRARGKKSSLPRADRLPLI